jgi:hypothetical protein
MHGQESQYVSNNLPEFVIEPTLLAMLGDLGQIAEDREQYQDD